jgi:hypothetical protein
MDFAKNRNIEDFFHPPAKNLLDSKFPVNISKILV